jgi:hypothetical protein
MWPAIRIPSDTSDHLHVPFRILVLIFLFSSATFP